MDQAKHSAPMSGIARQLLKMAAVRSGGMALYHRLRDRDVLTVLMLHRVLPTPLVSQRSADEQYTVSVELLRQLLQFVAQHYSIVTLEDVLASRRREKPLPPCPLLVTFDDGWNDNAIYAAPELRAAEIPWVMFVATDAVSPPNAWWQETLGRALRSGTATYETLWRAADEPSSEAEYSSIDDPTLALLLRYAALPDERRNTVLEPFGQSRQTADIEPDIANWQTLSTLHSNGVAIGVHGASHLPLTAMRDPGSDIGRAATVLAQKLGTDTALTMSFPHGRYDSATVEAARSLGMELMFTSDQVVNKCPGGWLLGDIVGRIPVSTDSLATLRGNLDPVRAMPWMVLRARI